VLPTPITPPAPPAGAISVNVGEWVASANCGASVGTSAAADEPFAVGVISVSRRLIPGRNGFLGVSLGDAETPEGGSGGGAAGTGAKILQVIPDSAAEKAGVKVDDVIIAVNSTPIANRTDLITTVQKYRQGDVVTLTIVRGDRTITLKAALGANTGESPEQSAMSALLGGAVSARSSDFPAVYQHDTVIRPIDCGGPIVDLEGNVIGINIARAGRTETYALPADVIVPLLEPMKSGKLAPVNANAPGPVKPGEKPTTLPGKGE
jgi:serine protease Do